MSVNYHSHLNDIIISPLFVSNGNLHKTHTYIYIRTQTTKQTLHWRQTDFITYFKF